MGLVGAERRRHGLGPFVFRDLIAAGARVPCFVTTNERSREAAESRLSAAGSPARGYLTVDAMLASESLDAVAIQSPSATHADYLEAALRAGLPVLCDKPLVWGRPGLALHAAEIVGAFERAGLLLWEICQWPYTLTAYELLFPGALASAPERFEMWMQPVSAGVQAFGDSLPHPLSLLQRLVPGGSPRLGDVRIAPEPGRDDERCVSFDYHSDAGCVAVAVHLEPRRSGRREAAYALDGRVGRRRISGARYRLSFVSDDGREVPLADPMTHLVTDFVAALRGAARAAPGREIVERMAMLDQLVDAHARRAPVGPAGTSP